MGLIDFVLWIITIVNVIPKVKKIDITKKKVTITFK